MQKWFEAVVILSCFAIGWISPVTYTLFNTRKFRCHNKAFASAWSEQEIFPFSFLSPVAKRDAQIVHHKIGESKIQNERTRMELNWNHRKEENIHKNKPNDIFSKIVSFIQFDCKNVFAIMLMVIARNASGFLN